VKVRAWRAVALAVALAAPAAAFAQNALPPDTAAKINGQAILTKDLVDRLMQLYGKQELQTLIYYVIVDQEAQRRGVQVTDQQVNDEIANMRKRWGDRFPNYLASIGLTEKLLPQQVREELQVQGLIGKEIVVTDQDIEDFYKEHQSRYHRPATVRLRIIVTDAKAQADAALAALKKGAKFPDVVQQYSVDEGTKAHGGDVGMDLPQGAFVPEWKPLEDAAFALPVNGVSDVLSVGDKFAIIQVTATHGPEDIGLAQAHDEIKTELFKTKLDQRSRDYLKDLYDQAAKEINRSLWE
jgi:foldase protein PrsA